MFKLKQRESEDKRVVDTMFSIKM